MRSVVSYLDVNLVIEFVSKLLKKLMWNTNRSFDI